MNDLILKNYTFPLAFQPKAILELGGGLGADALYLKDKFAAAVTMIDKKKPEKELPGINFIEGNYFDQAIIDQVGNFALLVACYALCFSDKETIIKYLPQYFEKMNNGGIFYVGGFTKEDKVVTSRKSELSEPWFKELLERYFEKIEVKSQEYFEEAHQHTHNILELVAIGKK